MQRQRVGAATNTALTGKPEFHENFLLTTDSTFFLFIALITYSSASSPTKRTHTHQEPYVVQETILALKSLYSYKDIGWEKGINSPNQRDKFTKSKGTLARLKIMSKFWKFSLFCYFNSWGEGRNKDYARRRLVKWSEKRWENVKRRSMNMKDGWGESKYQTRMYRLLLKAVKRKKRWQGGGREKKKGIAYAFYPCFNCIF